MARNYSNVAVATALASTINSSDASITVGSNTGYPATPFTVIIDPGTPSEEVCEVTNVAGTTWTITRGVDGTPATSHASGAVVEHGVSARDWREPNEHVSATTSVHGIANTSSLVTLTGTQTLTNKTLTSPTLNGGTWSSPSFSGGTFTSPTLVTPTIASFVNAQHDHGSSAGGGSLADSGQFFFPAPVTSSDTHTCTGFNEDLTGMAITYTAPSAWPSNAKRILYNLTFYFSGANTVSVGFVSDGSTVLANTPFRNDDVADINTYTLSWPGALTTAGASHTAKVKVQGVGGDAIIDRAFWLSLV